VTVRAEPVHKSAFTPSLSRMSGSTDNILHRRLAEVPLLDSVHYHRFERVGVREDRTRTDSLCNIPRAAPCD
jgi:hypothetical protein